MSQPVPNYWIQRESELLPYEKTMKDRLHWLASWPKSGNTWVRMLLFAYFFQGLDLNKATHFFMSEDNQAALQGVAPRPLQFVTAEEMVHIRPAALLKLIDNIPMSPTMVKAHSANIIVNGIPLFPPYLSGPSVYLVRDPRDTAVSYAEFLGKTLEEAVFDFTQNDTHLMDKDMLGIYQYLTNWPDHVGSWIKTDCGFPVLLVRYEDLVDDTPKELGRILEHLGFDPDPGKLEKATEITSFTTLQNWEDQYGFAEASPKAERFFARGTYGFWRDHFSAEPLERLENFCQEAMKALGYPLETVTEESDNGSELVHVHQ